MKLFLCSLGITNTPYLEKLINKPSDQIKCGVIKNPMDLKPQDKREFLYNLVDEGFRRVGINKKDIDLKDYQDGTNIKELSETIETLDMLWVTGGNVFYIRYLFEKLGLIDILKNALEKGVVYGGDSAGALLVCPTLNYLDKIDDVSQVPQVYYSGLNIIDFVPLPHWEDERFQPMLTEIKEKLEREGNKVVPYSNSQSIVIEDGSYQIVG